MIFRVLDIETVVDESVWTRGSPKYQIVPSTTVVESVRAVELDVVPPPHACRVVAISCVDLGFDAARDPRYWLDNCWTVCRWAVPSRAEPGSSADRVASREGLRPGGLGTLPGFPSQLSAEADAQEAVLLAAFAHAMETTREVNLITWNGRSFDLPVIVMRSLKHKISSPWYYKDRDVRYRYSTEGHLDLMDFLGDYGATRYMRLGDIARLCGLPGKTDTTGADVAVLYAQALADPSLDSELRARVARYCLQDTLQTALVHLRGLHLRGKITPQTHDAVLETFRSSPAVAAAIDLPWDRLWMCPRAQAELPGVVVLPPEVAT